MRIGIDIDETICNTWEYIKPYFEGEYEVKAGLSYFKALNCTLEEYYDFCKKKLSKIMLEIPIKTDAIKYINKLKQDGHEIFFITARSDFDNSDPYIITKTYLDKHNIKYDLILVNSLKKDEVALKYNIDLLIDDSIKHCTNVSSKGIKVLMIETKYNKDCNAFKKAKDWEEIYNLIKNQKI